MTCTQCGGSGVVSTTHDKRTVRVACACVARALDAIKTLAVVYRASTAKTHRLATDLARANVAAPLAPEAATLREQWQAARRDEAERLDALLAAIAGGKP